MNTPVRLVLVLGAALIAALPAAAQQLYKYVGPDGKVQYSDRPPTDGRKAEKVTNSRISSAGAGGAGAATGAAASDAPKSGASSAPRTAAEQEQAFRKRRMESEEKSRKDEKLAQDQQHQSEACANARRDLSAAQSGQRMARFNDAGERIFLDDAGVQGEVSRLQRDIAATCK